ncbi:hypothetical protein JX265_003818 [Neoarthrinium moseri]|uniref:Uncharacterized protein n=1 Tax=Neoarthrinium moseri TaxID=1658444 RepID=A0A9P9WTG8_9PEZI|nr:hypothetical protein JX265_003818 [Neoarthrinium moseri]
MECWSGDILAAICYFNRRPQGGRKYVFKFIRPHLAGSPPSFCDKKMLSLNADRGKAVGVMDRAASGRGSRQRAKLVRKIRRLMNKLAAAVNPAEAANIEEQKDDLTGEVFGCLDFSAAKMPMRRTMFTEAKYPNGEEHAPGEELKGTVFKTIHVKLPEPKDPNQKKSEMSDFDAPSMRIETVTWRILQLIANDLRNVQMIRLAERKRANEERKAAKEVRELPPEQEPEDPDWDDPTPITPPRTRQNGLMTRLIQKSAAVKGEDNPKENKAIMGVQKVEQLITAGNNSMLSHIFHTSCLDKAEPPPASLIGWLNFFLAKAPAAAAVVFQAVKEICEPEKDGLPNCVFIVVDPPWVQQHLYAMLQLAGVKVNSQILGTFTPYSPTSASATKASTSETAAQVFRIRCNQPASRYLNEVLGLGPSGLLNNPTRAAANASSLIARYAINCPEQMGPLGNVKKWDILAACCRLAKGRHLGVPFEPNEVKEYPTVNANNVEDIRKSIKKQAQDMETKQKLEKKAATALIEKQAEDVSASRPPLPPLASALLIRSRSRHESRVPLQYHLFAITHLFAVTEDGCCDLACQFCSTTRPLTWLKAIMRTRGTS